MAEMSQTERRLRDLKRTVVEARSVPMSASCMVNRADTLATLDTIIAGLEEDFEDRVRAESAGPVKRGWDIVDQTEIVQEAKTRAAHIDAKAKAEQEELQAEADRYVETRLAAFEAELQVTLSRVGVMRERLMGRVRIDDDEQQTAVIPRWSV
ncbi:MAG: hypothetical protein LBV06_04140 [Propionibacteriaceae bacterium]|jgi:hypothetical protein|nr:hypothetical protein [Propionibacteriaceae bacterium]